MKDAIKLIIDPNQNPGCAQFIFIFCLSMNGSESGLLSMAGQGFHTKFWQSPLYISRITVFGSSWESLPEDLWHRSAYHMVMGSFRFNRKDLVSICGHTERAAAKKPINKYNSMMMIDQPYRFRFNCFSVFVFPCAYWFQYLPIWQFFDSLYVKLIWFLCAV